MWIERGFDLYESFENFSLDHSLARSALATVSHAGFMRVVGENPILDGQRTECHGPSGRIS